MAKIKGFKITRTDGTTHGVPVWRSTVTPVERVR